MQLIKQDAWEREREKEKEILFINYSDACFNNFLKSYNEYIKMVEIGN